MIQGTQPICNTCRHSMLTKIEVMIQATKQERGHIIPVGTSREVLAQPWCFRQAAGVAIQAAIVECEGYEPADGPKEMLKPSDFELKAV